MEAYNDQQYLPTYKGCLVCGQKEVNPGTLNIRFKVTKEGVETEFTPCTHQEGYKNVVHGGIITAVLDETIGWAVAVQRKKYFVTGELNVRFLRPLRVGTKAIVKGRPVEHKLRYSIAEGEIQDEQGNIYAKAAGKFFLLSDERAKQVHDYLTFQDGDLDFLV
jgi:uncharacterized protein (TIGR00369 family)